LKLLLHRSFDILQFSSAACTISRTASSCTPIWPKREQTGALLHIFRTADVFCAAVASVAAFRNCTLHKRQAQPNDDSLLSARRVGNFRAQFLFEQLRCASIGESSRDVEIAAPNVHPLDRTDTIGAHAALRPADQIPIRSL
jgi:hypothetical protein